MRTKKINKMLTVMMAFAMAFAMLVNPMPAMAEEVIGTEEIEITVGGDDGTVLPMAHQSYYPTSGTNSGVFSGLQSNAATYVLPSGGIHISYSIEGASQCYLRFYYNGSLVAVSSAMNGNSTGNATVALPWTGNYTVIMYYPNGTSSTQVIYGYNLYTN